MPRWQRAWTSVGESAKARSLSLRASSLFCLRATVLVGVVLGCLVGVMASMCCVTMRRVGMVGTFFGSAGLMMFGSLAVVTSSVLVVLGCFGVVLGALMLHGKSS